MLFTFSNDVLGMLQDCSIFSLYVCLIKEWLQLISSLLETYMAYSGRYNKLYLIYPEHMPTFSKRSHRFITVWVYNDDASGKPLLVPNKDLYSMRWDYRQTVLQHTLIMRGEGIRWSWTIFYILTIELDMQIRAVQLIECDSHAHLVSKASSVIGTKSPSPAFRWSSS